MTRNKIYALARAAALVAGLGLFACVASADAAQNSPAPQSQTIQKTRFEVVRTMPQSLEVRSLTNSRDVHTFTFSPEVRTQMEKIQNAGGYRYGDKVVVWYHPGAYVALKIKGKPSKPK